MLEADAAASFASTPAGYISSLAVPAILILIGYFGRRYFNQQDLRFAGLEQADREISIAMTANTQALALLVSQVAPMQTSISMTIATQVTLGESVAVLKSKVADHELWAQREHERLLGARGISG